MKIRCLIVDDEHLARKLLEDYVSKVPELKLVAKCENALEANRYLQEEAIDLLFLDIQMPDLTGIELLRSVKQQPAVILTTAYSEYALEGYELDVVDYLLKPIAFERFVQAVNKTTKRLKLKKGQETPSAQKDFLFVKADYKKVKVNYDDILYIEGLREYVSIFTPDQRVITLESMKNLEQTLPSDRFMRVHKSYIANMDKVKAVDGNRLEIGDKKIPIGKSYKEKVLAFLTLK